MLEDYLDDRVAWCSVPFQVHATTESAIGMLSADPPLHPSVGRGWHARQITPPRNDDSADHHHALYYELQLASTTSVLFDISSAAQKLGRRARYDLFEILRMSAIWPGESQMLVPHGQMR